MKAQPLLIFQSAKFDSDSFMECYKIPIEEIAEICDCNTKRFPKFKSEIWFHDNCIKFVSPSKSYLLDAVERVLNNFAEVRQYNCSVNIKCQRSSIG